jgi:hypothetical protein
MTKRTRERPIANFDQHLHEAADLLELAEV